MLTLPIIAVYLMYISYVSAIVFISLIYYPTVQTLMADLAFLSVADERPYNKA